MRPSIARTLSGAVTPWPLALALAACSSTPPPAVGITPRDTPTSTASAAPAGPPPPPLLPAQVVAQIDETSSPYFARRGDEGLVLVSVKGRWLTRVIGKDGAPKSAAPVDVAAAPADAQMGALRAAGDGYLAVWAEAVAKNRAVKVLALDAEGKARGEPALVAQIADDLAWVDLLPNAKGALVIWQIPRDERPEVTAAPVSAAGKPEGPPAVVARDVMAWEAIATERGAAAVMVVGAAPEPAPAPRGKPAGKKKGAVPAPAEARTKLGKIQLAEIDAKGKVGAPVMVSPEATAQVDAMIAEVSGKYVLAWTDERDIDACVYVAAVEPGGKIAAAPHRATPPIGEQALVSLVAAPWAPGAPRSKRALLAWEDQLKVPREGRLIHLATVGPDAALGKERATLTFSASGPPDLVPDGDGFAAMTLAPVPGLGEEAPQPGKKTPPPPVLPVFVRFGPDLTVLASEPVRAAPFGSDEKVPYLTRSLSCHAGSCTTVGSDVPAAPKEPGQKSPGAPLAIVSLPIRQSVWKAPAYREADEAPPRPTSVTALFDGDHLAKVAAAEVPGGTSLVGWVTYYLDGARGVSKGKKQPRPSDDGPAATLGVRAIGADGAPGKTVVISKKALSIGGVALAPAAAADGKKPETVLGWVARERGEPQVFVTKLGPDGEKLAQKGVTVLNRKNKGAVASEASDVAVAWDGSDGWIVAWSDTRDGNAEIYVAKVDRNMTKVIPDRRITDAPGDSAEVQLAVRGKEVLLVWSDARGNPDEGSGDIFTARLDAGTLKKIGPEIKVFASASHSRTPQLAATPKGYMATWIEEAGEGKPNAAGSEAGVRVAQLDDKGMLLGAPELVKTDGAGQVTSATLGCAGKACRGVLTTALNEALLLGAFEIAPGAPAGPVKTIAALTGSVTQDVSPVFASGAATSLFFADDAVGGSGRVRWMRIAWP